MVKNEVFDIRKEMRITQEELAKGIGVTRQTIIAIEKGNYTPSVILALKIARYFKRKVEELFKLE
ncbi:transcriptional regulator [Candidatus Roizmanbacteria bacterium RIFCSPHIGHO2_02_FULL_39_9]|uniref:Transcriptional regulator n=2 Tax=Candidatus Roizmaniibacteriota TaxID=1752723 RepID=A0A1F7I024_9BACT|nr:MAG: transcriptional regulator [Candidatus Roizmanbacteria bacterium RIFCSPHIGHO2_02_FULL_39_9]OGK36734.1 MAG: transcriptional regulator [Candidatus Roizmanbacteria bacterium RIFCSPHIGHO2_12_FULL_39_8]